MNDPNKKDELQNRMPKIAVSEQWKKNETPLTCSDVFSSPGWKTWHNLDRAWLAAPGPTARRPARARDALPRPPASPAGSV